MARFQRSSLCRFILRGPRLTENQANQGAPIRFRLTGSVATDKSIYPRARFDLMTIETMSGGYVPDYNYHPPPQDLKPTSIAPVSPLLSLTPRQEDRLHLHLDDRLLSLERDERKQCVPLHLPILQSNLMKPTSAFGSLQALLGRLLPLLHLILQIPPVEPWSSLRISYLLTFTGSVSTYITSLPLVVFPSRATSHHRQWDRNGSGDAVIEEQAGRTMRALLDFLGEVDKGWQAVLRGDGWFPPSHTGPRSGKAVKVDYGGSVGGTERYDLLLARFSADGDRQNTTTKYHHRWSGEDTRLGKDIW